MCEESYKCVFVCVSGRMKTPPLDLLIGLLITHRDNYFPIHHFQKAGGDTGGLMRDECVNVLSFPIIKSLFNMLIGV